ncbi:unnamed protein product [Symbiodinium sp. KB8]|nr:unnamed protein product [Symbiodinium sp. KB8]
MEGPSEVLGRGLAWGKVAPKAMSELNHVPEEPRSRQSRGQRAPSENRKSQKGGVAKPRAAAGAASEADLVRLGPGPSFLPVGSGLVLGKACYKLEHSGDLVPVDEFVVSSSVPSAVTSFDGDNAAEMAKATAAAVGSPATAAGYFPCFCRGYNKYEENDVEPKAFEGDGGLAGVPLFGMFAHGELGPGMDATVAASAEEVPKPSHEIHSMTSADGPNAARTLCDAWQLVVVDKPWIHNACELTCGKDTAPHQDVSVVSNSGISFRPACAFIYPSSPKLKKDLATGCHPCCAYGLSAFRWPICPSTSSENGEAIGMEPWCQPPRVPVSPHVLELPEPGDMYLALAGGLEQCPNPGGSYSEASLSPAQIRDDGREHLMTCVCPACKASAPAAPSLKFYAYAATCTHTWHDEAAHTRNISRGERGEQDDPLMPALYALALCAQRQLQDGEAVFAFLASTSSLGRLASTRSAALSCPRCAWDRARILHRGETRADLATPLTLAKARRASTRVGDRTLPPESRGHGVLGIGSWQEHPPPPKTTYPRPVILPD